MHSYCAGKGRAGLQLHGLASPLGVVELPFSCLPLPSGNGAGLVFHLNKSNRPPLAFYLF